MVYNEGEFTERHVYDRAFQRVSTTFTYMDDTARGQSGENIASDTAVSHTEKLVYRTNHLTSTLFAVDEDGAVALHMMYDEWGNPQVDTDFNINKSGVSNLNNYTGYTYDDVLGIYYAQNRFYDAGIKRFIQEDPIKDGMNWYSYIGNSPLNATDPWRLDSYILYDPYDVTGAISYEAAKIIAKDLETMYGTATHLLPITSPDNFINTWNNEVGYDANGNEVMIDVTIVYTHGGSCDLAFGKDEATKWFNVSRVQELEQKTMTAFVSLACDTGNSTVDENIATQMMRLQPGIKIVIAADASVTTYVETTGLWLWKKNVVKINTVPVGYRKATMSEEDTFDGYKVYSQTASGEPNINKFGGFGHIFNGITDLIKSAQANSLID